MVLKAWEIHGKAMEKHGENSMDSLENHGAWSWSKIPWFSWGNFDAFHASMEQENFKNIPHESMESMESETMKHHGKHGKKAWEFTKMKAQKSREAWYFLVYYF